MFDRKLRRIAIAYVALQAVIWAKCVLFFVWFGHGKSIPFNWRAFPENALLFDFFFHNGMHAAIAVLALLFGKNIQRIEWLKIIAVVFVAAGLHNIAYWFTASHESAWYSAVDFARDSALLFAAVSAGYLLNALWKKVKKARRND